MSMEITSLDFQLSTDNQNGRHLATNFFFGLIFFSLNSLATWSNSFQGLRVCWHFPFSRATENEAMGAIFIF